jgi:hypothetical protein
MTNWMKNIIMKMISTSIGASGAGLAPKKK